VDYFERVLNVKDRAVINSHRMSIHEDELAK
jgi:hypothetical protein